MTSTQPVVAHATDLLPDGGVAFAHAVAIAQHLDARLVSLYAETDEREQRPAPTQADLVGWADGRTVPHETHVHDGFDDPVDTLLEALHDLRPAVLVVGHRPANAFQRLMRGSVSTGLALNTHVPTLILAIGGRGFVDPDDGTVSLARIVVPVGSLPASEAALAALAEIVKPLAAAPIDVHLIACGGAAAIETLALPKDPKLRFHPHRVADSVAHAVTTLADELDADLILMSSRGQDSVHDVFVGTNTEQVVRHTQRPILCVPIG